MSGTFLLPPNPPFMSAVLSPKSLAIKAFVVMLVNRLEFTTLCWKCWHFWLKFVFSCFEFMLELLPVHVAKWEGG